MRATLFLLAIPAFALSNRITIHDVSAMPRSSEPFTVSRVFAQSEISGFPQPFIEGIAAPLWQADVLNSWPDGSVRQANISFAASIPSGGSIQVDFRNSPTRSSGGTALTKAQMLEFNASHWGAKIQGTASGFMRSVSARAILSQVEECPADGWVAEGCFKYRLRGPMATQIILFGGTSNSFGWECDSSASVCPAVSPYATTAWKTPSDLKYNSIHPVFVLTFYTGWNGVKEEFVLENSWFKRLQDLRFDLALFNGENESNPIYSKPATVFYALRRARKVFWDGAPTTGWTSEYRPGFRIDYNRQYMLYSRAIPFMAPELNSLGVAGTYDLNSTAINLDIAHNLGTGITELQWCESTSATCGPQSYGWPGGGTKPELGLLSRAYARYLVSFSSDLYEALLQIGLQAGSYPLHVRESSTNLEYTMGISDNAFGRQLSLDARPLHRLAREQSGAPVGSKMSFTAGEGVVGTITCMDATRPFTIGCTVTDTTQTFNRWTIDDAHSPRAAYIPYVITGDWYFLEEQMFAASQVMADESQGSSVTPGCQPNFARHGEAGPGNDWGIPHSGHNIRVEAWGTLHLGQTMLSLASGTPEKTYYLSRLQKIIDVRRGMVEIAPNVVDYNPGGSAADPCPTDTYNPATSTPWCWGFVSRMERKSNPLALSSIQGTYTGWGMNLVAACASNMWFENYMRAVYGFLTDAGIAQLEPMLARMSKTLIKQTIQSNAKGTSVTDYSVMIVKASNGQPSQNIAELVSAIREETTLRIDIGATELVLGTNHQFASVNCSLANSVWLGGIQKFVLEPGTPNEEMIETLGQPSCQAPGTYTIPIAKRGVMGTTARSHAAGSIMRRAFVDFGSTAASATAAGYANIAQAAWAYAYPYVAVDEVNGSTLTGRRAYEYAMSVMTYQNQLTSTSCVGIGAADCQNPMWAIRPRHTIENVRSKSGDGSVQFWFTAPTMDAFRVGVSTSPFLSSADETDLTDVPVSKSRTLTIGGLTHALYNYRITCGPFGGISRVYGSFQM